MLPKVAMMEVDNVVARKAVNRSDAGHEEEALEQPAIMEEEKEACKREKYKNIPGPWWYGNAKRDKYFSDLHLKISYFQQQLPMFKEIESELEYAKYCDGPQSKEVERILQHSLP